MRCSSASRQGGASPTMQFFKSSLTLLFASQVMFRHCRDSGPALGVSFGPVPGRPPDLSKEANPQGPLPLPAAPLGVSTPLRPRAHPWSEPLENPVCYPSNRAAGSWVISRFGILVSSSLLNLCREPLIEQVHPRTRSHCRSPWGGEGIPWAIAWPSG